MSGPALHFIKESDTVFAVGASMTRGSTLTANIPAGKTLIHCSNDPRDIGKSYFVDHPLLGDAKLVLRQLLDALRDRVGKGARRSDGGRAAEIARVRDAWLKEWESQLTSAEVPMNAYRVMHEFMEEVDSADAIVTHDAGGPRDQLLPFYRTSTPHGYVGWGKSHQLGTGVGFMLGAKRAAPDKPASTSWAMRRLG